MRHLMDVLQPYVIIATDLETLQPSERLSKLWRTAIEATQASEAS